MAQVRVSRQVEMFHLLTVSLIIIKKKEKNKMN